MTTDLASIFAVAARGRFETFLDDPRWQTFEDGSLRVGRKWYRRGFYPTLLGDDQPDFPAVVPDVLLRTVWNAEAHDETDAR
jgi:hypothetical protein